ncbi:uncharacterized protein OCT59_017013 [Rhizophagus irregularis]|uniref:uncharacterized protein n=1 Tax=Rhizophagus irregularis TaxID=588596 RepID=UPI0033202FCC|nr:hypothetical protein OCT59_017013 [Rhizophagus irregularis]
MANLQAILSIYLRVIILYFCNFIVINLPYDNNGGSSFTTICYIDSLQKNFCYFPSTQKKNKESVERDFTVID